MKVKKNKIKLFALIFLLLIITVFSFGVYFATKYKLNVSDGKLFIKNNFSLNPATNEEIIDYNSKNQFNVDVLHYEIHINLITGEEKIKSKVIITGVPKSETINYVELNFLDNFSVSDVFFNSTLADYIYENNKLVIKSNKSITDTFKIEVNYEGTPENLGFGSFNFGQYNEQSVVYTLNEPIFASTWFPCNDFPTDKVLTDIFITNDSTMISVSNGILTDVRSNGEKKTYHWKTQYPIATYLISIYSGNYTYFNDYFITDNNDSMKIEYFVFPDHIDEAKKDFSIHPKAIKIFSNLFGEYPFVKEKYGVAEFLWNFGAMEHQTITGIGKNFISGNQFFTGMLVHELAHQWWGNAVTLSDWKDIWLNEGFATYSEALYWESKSGASALQSTMISFLTGFNGTTLYNPNKLFSRTIYNKGAWVLHMLRNEVGDSLFFSILKNYFEKYKYKNATTYDFKNLVEKLTSKDFTQFFEQWVFKGEGKIEIEYSFENKVTKNNRKVLLHLKQTQNGYKKYNFSLEFKLVFSDGKTSDYSVDINSIDTILTYPVNFPVSEIKINPDGLLALTSRLVKSD